MFPTVSLNFAGGASMFLRPQDYLLQQNSVVSSHETFLVTNYKVTWVDYKSNCILLVSYFCLVVKLAELIGCLFSGWGCCVVHRFSENQRSRNYHFKRYKPFRLYD